jgi:hypothetical protein
MTPNLALQPALMLFCDEHDGFIGHVQSVAVRPIQLWLSSIR